MAQAGADARHQFRHAERLDIIVGPEIERVDLGAFIVRADSTRSAPANACGIGDHREPAAIGQAEVKHHDIGLFGIEHRERLGRVLGQLRRDTPPRRDLSGETAGSAARHRPRERCRH